MVYSWGKANAWCWVSLFPKAKCISPRVRRARPAGTNSFTPALTAKRQQWIMFINQPHSSSGGAAEGKAEALSCVCLLSDQKTSSTDGPWLLRHVQALWHEQQVQRQRWLNHTRHLCRAWWAASALENALPLLEKVAQLLSQPPWAGNPSVGQEQQCQLPASLWHTPEGSRLGKANSIRNRPTALISGLPTLQDQCFHPFSSVTSCPRVGAKLLMSLAFSGWGLHQADVSGSHHMHPWPGRLPNAFRRHWPDTKSHYFWKQEIFCMCQ